MSRPGALAPVIGWTADHCPADGYPNATNSGGPAYFTRAPNTKTLGEDAPLTVPLSLEAARTRWQRDGRRRMGYRCRPSCAQSAAPESRCPGAQAQASLMNCSLQQRGCCCSSAGNTDCTTSINVGRSSLVWSTMRRMRAELGMQLWASNALRFGSRSACITLAQRI